MSDALNFRGRVFWEVGCRKCGKGGDWKIFTDGEGKFVGVHSCGHQSNFELSKKPDVEQYDARFFQ